MKFVIGVAIALFIWLQYQLWLAPGGIVDIWHLRHRVAKQKKIDEKWDLRNHVLKADINDLRHGNEAIEERVRDNMGMIKRGETYYRVIDTSKAKAVS